MEMRSQVYSPLQNSAVWLGAWIYDLVATEEVIDAFVDLGGPHTLGDGGLLDLLRRVRETVEPLIDAPFTEPLITLALSGPGDSRAALRAAKAPEGGLIIRGVDKQVCHALIPERVDNATVWTWDVIDVPPNTEVHLSPGDADALLTAATREAAALIDATGYSALAPSTLKHPRLTVGALSDFYDTPGLPHAVPPRAAKLFARADRVAAIVETVQQTMGEHSLDPQLITLWRHIRAARMAGVSYTLAEFARL